jgi:hypothetical protein
LKRAFGYIYCEQCINIAMYSANSYWAWKCNVKAPVVGEGVGLETDDFFYNAYTEDGSPLRYGLITPPNELNIILSSWYYDFQVLDRIYETGGINQAPYDLAIDQGGYLKEWTTDTWIDPDDSIEKTKNTRTYRTECPGEPGVPLRFTRPVTGAQGEIVNVTQYSANLYYVKQCLTAWAHDTCKDVKTSRMIGDDTMEIYWDNLGFWNTYYGNPYLSPFHVLTMNPISGMHTETVTCDTLGWFNLTHPIYWIISAYEGATPLTVGTDINIYTRTSTTPPGPHKCTARMDTDGDPTTQYNGGARTIELTYYYELDSLGYTVGNIAWDISLEGHDLFYIIDHTPGTGGFAALKKNPRSFREKRILGEIDFIRKTGGPPGFCPDTQKIDIYDVVVAASAYFSSGCGVPSANWFPGADVAPGGQACCCEVNIYDIVTIASRYGDEFDCIP